MISSSPRAVSKKPWKNSEELISRVPFGPCATITASSVRQIVGRSDAGSPWASEPPMVPQWRTWGSPTRPAAYAISGQCCFATRVVVEVVVARERPDREVVAGVA